MAKTKQGKRDVDAYTIKGTNKVVRVGDCVLMRPADTDKPQYVARVERMESDGRGGVRVRVRWYYRPEEAKGGRRPFHGAKELFLSDHFDTQSAHTIEGKCIVHSFKSYTKLDNVGPEDFYCRFDYKAATGAFTPDRVAVYCKCEMPYNPDDLMVQCEGCKDWFHPSCMGMTIEQAKKIDHYMCSDCAKENGAKRPSNSYPVSPNSDSKGRNPGVYDNWMDCHAQVNGFASNLYQRYKTWEEANRTWLLYKRHQDQATEIKAAIAETCKAPEKPPTVNCSKDLIIILLVVVVAVQMWLLFAK